MLPLPCLSFPNCDAGIILGCTPERHSPGNQASTPAAPHTRGAHAPLGLQTDLGVWCVIEFGLIT